MSNWIDEAKRAQASEIAPHVGIGHVRGRTVAPCPACGAEKRGSKDRRGPVDLHERDGRVRNCPDFPDGCAPSEVGGGR